MNAKSLLACLALVMASLFNQTRADCLGAASPELETVEIPEFAKQVESSLRKLNPSLADLPLNDLLESSTVDSDVNSFFKTDELNDGAEKCAKFIFNVDSMLRDAGCEYEELDLNKIIEENAGKHAKVVEVVSYMNACLVI